MKTISVLIVTGIFLSLGCARVRVEAPKDPIKVDISMRLDIYQHVKNDINDIENLVSGPQGQAKPKDKQSLLHYLLGEAYAQEGLGPEVEQAALRRKDRRPELVSLEAKGAIGENKSGLVEIRDSAKAGAGAAGLVEQENSDRMAIYQAVARKNGAGIDEVKKLYAKRLQADAPPGTPIEVLDESSGQSAWKVK